MLSCRLALQTSRATAPRAAIVRRTIPASSVARSYAQTAPSNRQQSVKPPVALFGLDGTYASALYTAAAKTSNLDTVAKSLASLSSLFKRDRKLSAILHSPMLKPSDRVAIANELMKHLTQPGVADKQDTVRNFMNTLVGNNRLGLLEGVCLKFESLMSAWNQEVELTVTSASPLDNRTLSRLESAVAKSEYVGQGKKLKVTNKVNPDIIGGLLVEIGDRTIDLSVSSKMLKLNKLLTDSL
ncbi:ATP synthase F0 subcomplex subunit OSCP atp5 [Trichoglossum hirsutum]|uniref:ATP synthase subunit 5, mitochondrial n=1 Tax=Trichoglossum hirsutum TaxID=265104 RepID=A0A9P8LH01_9PEZI|nr:ATP synthase F0 subcomplex subunit OSCP atp5 [Trichoglossum hirsutum]